MPKAAVIIVDVQYDFLPPDGSLAVPHGDEILPVIEGLLDRSKWDWPVIVASQDYHPKEHISFASSHPPHDPFSKVQLTDANGKIYEQTIWPDHCVQGTRGAEIEKGLRGQLKPWGVRVKVVRKGTNIGIEAYSAFEGYVTEATDPAEPISDHEPQPTESPLTKYLRSEGIDTVVIVGLATDFCVSATARSAISASFETILVAPGMRGISQDDGKKAWDEIERLGGTVVGKESGDDWEIGLRQKI
ncbi:hypothetical protein CI109_105050 [Kwoniella shandongensis]|uniref:nicotinamidase n=1 Tax=Kwoniella shandongensis TaxID=1734106 RepID=A0A5M6BYJ4_9TREE|nr:uncharacterized protein CI109_004350 [Kwoniella shandongensis]KAA5527290.1 hypothetical protein CI109_004350 [Kwoniella shandongensis]